MEIDQCFQGSAAARYGSDRNRDSSSEKWRSTSEAKFDVEDDDSSSMFECSICLDTVQEPVVTLCGHLFCWACIDKWICAPNEYDDDNQKQCPVCKAKISHRTLIPIYGGGRTPKTRRRSEIGLPLPERPSGPSYAVDAPRSQVHLHLNDPHQTQMYHPSYHGGSPSSPLSTGGIGMAQHDPLVGMFHETVSSRLFGIEVRDTYGHPRTYHLTMRSNSRVRRHIMQAEMSLGRIHFFLLCCAVLCLLLF